MAVLITTSAGKDCQGTGWRYLTEFRYCRPITPDSARLERKMMTVKHKMSSEELESINSHLYDSFDPEQELWIIGGSTQYTLTASATYRNGQMDTASDFDIDFD